GQSPGFGQGGSV
nr:Chain C, FG-repeat [synthetic construct]